MGQIKKLYQDSGNVETIVSTETNAVYPITASSAVYHESAWGTGGTGQSVSSILAALNQGYLYVGLATPSTNPGSYNHKVFYIAGESGTYTNFGGIEVSGLTILKSDGNGWTADSVGISGGGGGGSTSGGYIGKTAVQNSAAAQALTGITSLSLEGNAQRIYFGDSSHYLEWDATNSAFHFSHGMYSSDFVIAGGVGSSGSGGGGATELKGLSDVDNNLAKTEGSVLYCNGTTWTNKILALKDLSDVNNSLNPAAKNVLWYDTTSSKWDAHALTYTDITDFPALGTSSGFLKYTYSGGSGSWSLANGTVTLTNVMGQATGRTRIVTIDGTDVYAPSSGGSSGTLYLGSQGHSSSLSDVSSSTFQNGQVLYYTGGQWTNASLDIADIGLPSSMSGSSGYLYYTNGSGWSLTSGGGGGSSTDTWRGIQVNGNTFKSTATSSGVMNFEAGANVSITTSGNTITIAASGGSSGSGVTISNLYTPGQDVLYHTLVTINNGTAYNVVVPEASTTSWGTLSITTQSLSGLKTFTDGLGVGSSSHTLTWDNANSRFVFNGNLYVTGNIVATGAVTAGA